MKMPPFHLPALSLRTKIVALTAFTALGVAAATTAASYHYRRQGLVEEIQAFVCSVAGTTAIALSGDEIETIRRPEDAATPAFRRAREVLDKVRRVNGLEEGEIYVLRPLAAEASLTEFVVMVQERAFIGDRYAVNLENRARLEEAWRTGRPVSTSLYRDAHGQWISGYAPLLDRAGRPVAIVETDAEVTRLLDREGRELRLALLIGLGAFAIAVVPGLLLAASITRGVRTLASGMERFRSGQNDVQIRVRSGDELESLGHAFNEMIVSLRERLALLTYVSRFTAEAVRRSHTDPSWLTGSEQEVIVLFADLRGFTSFSEHRSAGDLVHDLNRLLAVQADVVLLAGGDVDKFVGDAVMAVFVGDDPTAAFACARQLLERVRMETHFHGWNLALGIGIHCGRAVVGSIGSETRRDFTAIGHTVNFAARLCDRAAPWEVLVSGEFFGRLSNLDQACFRETEPMRFKNVQQITPVYRHGLPPASVPEPPPATPDEPAIASPRGESVPSQGRNGARFPVSGGAGEMRP